MRTRSVRNCRYLVRYSGVATRSTAFDAMIDYAQALEILLKRTSRLLAESCALGDAVGRVTADEVISPIALPSFDHAAMDGYALPASTQLEAGSQYAVLGTQAAGDSARPMFRAISEKGAYEIMTGARMPDGLDAVVAVERTQCLGTDANGSPSRILLLDPLRAGENVRYAGSDVGRDTSVLAATTRVEAAHIMLLAALGLSKIEVVRRPRVAIICTGKELQADRNQPLAAERIHNSNGPYLCVALGTAGAQVMFCETVDDTATTYAAALQRAIDVGVDMVISTGAVSMGRYDFVPAALRRFDAQLLFHKVAMRPGKPLLCASIANGPLIIGLPGTPMAVAVGFRFVVMPVLRAMLGQGKECVLQAILDTPQQLKAGLRHFLRGRIYQGLDGHLHAAVCSQTEPFRIQPFADADIWVVLSETAGDCQAGARVDVVSIDPGGLPRINAAP
jgi:molybdopterin molybdotransferase